MAEAAGIAPVEEEDGDPGGIAGIGEVLSKALARFRGEDPETGETDYWGRGGLAGLLGMEPWHNQSPEDIAMGFAGATTPKVGKALDWSEMPFSRVQTSIAKRLGAQKTGEGKAYDEAGRRAWGGGGVKSRYYRLPDNREVRISNHPDRSGSPPHIDLVIDSGEATLSHRPLAGGKSASEEFSLSLPREGMMVDGKPIPELYGFADDGAAWTEAILKRLKEIGGLGLAGLIGGGGTAGIIGGGDDMSARLERAEGGGIDAEPQRLTAAEWAAKDEAFRAAHPELAPVGDGVDGETGDNEVSREQNARGGLAAFEDAGDWGRAMVGMPGVGPLGLAANAITGTGWAGNYNPDFLTVDDMNAGLGHTSKAAGIAERNAGIAPPSYDDDENERNAREVMEALGGASDAVEGYSGGSASDAQGRGGDVDVRRRGGAVDRRLAPTLPALAAGGRARGSDEDGGSRSGFLNSAVAGRTDQLHVATPPNSYVIPADVVSGLGEGNSLAGARLLQDMFQTGPYGVKMPPQPRIRQQATPSAPGMAERAKGGATKKPVPILAAGGEFIVNDRDLAKLFGTAEKGHQVLDHWVVQERKKIIDTMKKLPGPAKT